MNTDARGVVFQARLSLAGFASVRVGMTIVYTADGSTTDCPIVSPVPGAEGVPVPVGYITGGIDGQIVGVYQGGIIPVQGVDAIFDPINIPRGTRLTLVPPLAGSTSDSVAAAACDAEDSAEARIDAIACTDIPERDPDPASPVGFAIVNFTGSDLGDASSAAPKQFLSQIGHACATDTSGGGIRTYWFPYKLPPDVVTFKFSIACRDQFNTLGNAADFTDQKFAYGTPNAALDGWASAPTVITGITLPLVGNFWTSDELVCPTPNAAGYIMIGVTTPNSSVGAPLYRETDNWWGLIRFGDSDLTTLVGASEAAGPPYVMGFEYESRYVAATCFHDSIMLGVAQPPFKVGFDQSIDLLANGIMFSKNGCTASLINQWYDFVAWMLRDNWSNRHYLTDHNVFCFLGTNDFWASVVGTTGIVTWRLLCSLEQQCYANGAKRFIPWTIPPSSTRNANGNTEVAVYNAKVRGRGAGNFIDADLILRDPGTPTQLLPAYNCGDNIHLSAAGLQAIADAILALDPALD